MLCCIDKHGTCDPAIIHAPDRKAVVFSGIVSAHFNKDSYVSFRYMSSYFANYHLRQKEALSYFPYIDYKQEQALVKHHLSSLLPIEEQKDISILYKDIETNLVQLVWESWLSTYGEVEHVPLFLSEDDITNKTIFLNALDTLMDYGLCITPYKAYIALAGLIEKIQSGEILKPYVFLGTPYGSMLEQLFLLLYTQCSADSVMGIIEPDDGNDLFGFSGNHAEKQIKNFIFSEQHTKGTFIGRSEREWRAEYRYKDFEPAAFQTAVKMNHVCLVVPANKYIIQAASEIQSANIPGAIGFTQEEYYTKNRLQYKLTLGLNQTDALLALGLQKKGQSWPEYIYEHTLHLLEYIAGHQTLVFDTETTGIEQGFIKILELAAVEVINGKIENCFDFYRSLNIIGNVPDVIADLTGITNEVLASRGLKEELFVDNIKSVLSAPCLVAYNSQYDIPAVGADIGYYPNSVIVDLLEIVRVLYPDISSYKLGDVANALELNGVNSHNALDDTKLTAELLLYILKNTQEERKKLKENALYLAVYQNMIHDMQEILTENGNEKLKEHLRNYIRKYPILADNKRFIRLSKLEAPRALAILYLNNKMIAPAGIPVRSVYSILRKTYDHCILCENFGTKYSDFVQDRSKGLLLQQKGNKIYVPQAVMNIDL